MRSTAAPMEKDEHGFEPARTNVNNAYPSQWNGKRAEQSEATEVRCENARIVGMVDSDRRLVETDHKAVYVVASDAPVGTKGKLVWRAGLNPIFKLGSVG